jgi:uroporphyrinogen-III synthase
MQLNKIEILCTRPLLENIIAKAIENDINIDCIPFIRSETISGHEVIEAIQSLAAKKITAIFTSLNAVEAVITRFSAKPDWEIFCIGGVTKEEIVNFFGANAVKGSARNAETLAEKIIAQKNNDEIVFFCGDHRMEILPRILSANNINISEVIVYKTIHIPHIIEKNYEGIIFFSPSAVHSFFTENTIPTDIVLFAIGKTTADSIGTYVSNNVIISEWPRQEEMVEKVIDHFSNIKQINKRL